MSIIKESTHWYQTDGEPAYTQIIASGANKGKERNTTLRDARKLNLLPSVTTILGVMDKPALTIWKVDQAITSALTCPRQPEETEKDWMYRVKHQDATEAAREAANEGTRIHGVLENYFMQDSPKPLKLEDARVILPVVDAMKESIGEYNWFAEKSCVSEHGFAGKVDLHSDDWVVDFKTKDGDLSNVKCYEDHFRQLAAYRQALGRHEAQCANIFISRDTTDENGDYLVKIIIHKKEQSAQGWKEFEAILNTWQVIKKYYPQLELAA